MRRQRETTWDALLLAKRLYVDGRVAHEVLDTLARRGLLIVENEGFRYGPSRDELGRAIDHLASVHTQLLIPITHLLHSKPRPAVQQFAEAFRLREKE